MDDDWLPPVRPTTGRTKKRKFKLKRRARKGFAGLNRYADRPSGLDGTDYDAEDLAGYGNLPTSKVFNRKENMYSDHSLIATQVDIHDSQSYLTAQLRAKSNVFNSGGTRLCPAKVKFNEWVHKNFKEYTLTGPASGFAYVGSNVDRVGDLRFTFSIHRGNLTYDISGKYEEVTKFETWLSEEGFSTESISINWAFGADYRDMETFQLPLQMPEHKIVGAYPWLHSSVEQFSTEFLASSANILILIGQPGTGKTSFIKEMIAESGTSAMVTYDTGLLFSDGFFASFMSDDNCNLLILEDADTIMGSRKEGNTMMHRFLNASDGLVSLRKKKIVFTTNLPSINDVDPALLRQGRCFDVLHARPLNKVEAQAVADQIYGTNSGVVLDKDTYTLAEITNLKVRGVSQLARKIGF